MLFERDIVKYRFLPKKGVAALIAGLLKEFKVYGPVKKDGFPMYGNITTPGDINLLHSPTHISPKQYLFPQRETLLHFSSSVPDEICRQTCGKRA